MSNEKRDSNFISDDDSSKPSVKQDRDVELEIQCSNDHLMDGKNCEDSTQHNTGVMKKSASANFCVKKEVKKVYIDNLIF